MYPIPMKIDRQPFLDITRKLCDALYEYLTFDGSTLYPSYEPPSKDVHLTNLLESRDMLCEQLDSLEKGMENIEETNPTRIALDQMIIPLRQQVKFVESQINQLQKEMEDDSKETKR